VEVSLVSGREKRQTSKVPVYWDIRVIAMLSRIPRAWLLLCLAALTGYTFRLYVHSYFTFDDFNNLR